MVLISVIAYIVFATYTATGGEITPKKLFTTLSLLVFLRRTIFGFIQTVLSVVEGRVALIRLKVKYIVTDLLVVIWLTTISVFTQT